MKVVVSERGLEEWGSEIGKRAIVLSFSFELRMLLGSNLKVDFPIFILSSERNSISKILPIKIVNIH